MMIKSWIKRALIGAAAATIILTAASDQDWKSVNKPAQQPPQPVRAQKGRHTVLKPQVQESSSHIELERLHRQSQKADPNPEIGNVFKAISWYVPPPPPPPPPPPIPVPPPPPMAPPMPFSYLGRYEDGRKLVIFLLKDDRIYTVSEGEVIDNTYRVEHLIGEVLEMTYLPLNIRQTINVGAS
jgi:hypothetical protein